MSANLIVVGSLVNHTNWGTGRLGTVEKIRIAKQRRNHRFFGETVHESQVVFVQWMDERDGVSADWYRIVELSLHGIEAKAAAPKTEAPRRAFYDYGCSFQGCGEKFRTYEDMTTHYRAAHSPQTENPYARRTRATRGAGYDQVHVDGKVCSKCNQYKSAHEFYTSKGAPDGLRGECKECYKAGRQARGK